MKYKLMIALLLSCSVVSCKPYKQSFLSGITDWMFGIEHETKTIKHPVAPQEKTIDITNFTGDITIRTWAKDEILLEVTTSGPADLIDHVSVDIKSRKNKIYIKTIGLDSEEVDNCRVDYVLVVPKGCAINVQTETGDITIVNVTQPVTAKAYKGCINISGGKMISAETKYGNIDIETTDLQKTDRVLAMSTKGNVNLLVPEDTNATLYAKANCGKVTTQQKVALANVSTEISHKALAQLRKDVQGYLGNSNGEESSSEIRLLTERGNVKVNRA